MGLWAGLNLSLRLRGRTPDPLPPETAIGALLCHVTGSPARPFQPNEHQLRVAAPARHADPDKAKVKEEKARRASQALSGWMSRWLSERETATDTSRSPPGPRSGPPGR